MASRATWRTPSLGWSDPDARFEATVLLNAFGDRVLRYGPPSQASRIPHVFERGRPTLDLEVRRGFCQRLTLSLAGRNLTGAAVEYFQDAAAGPVVVESWRSAPPSPQRSAMRSEAGVRADPRAADDAGEGPARRAKGAGSAARSPSADRRARATVPRRRVKPAAALATLVLAIACSDALRPAPRPGAPEGVRAAATGMRSIRLEWRRTADGDLAGYRGRHSGRAAPAGGDGGLLRHRRGAGDDYGYRVRAQTRLDGLSPPSVVAGARTVQWPGIDVTVSTAAASAALAELEFPASVLRFDSAGSGDLGLPTVNASVGCVFSATRRRPGSGLHRSRRTGKPPARSGCA